MSVTSIRMAALTAALAFAASAEAADSCGSGCPKLPTKARSVSTAPVPAPLPLFPTPMLTATLAKGKKKSMLSVEAMMTTGLFAPGAPVSPAIFVDVNGIPMEPSSAGPVSAAATDCGSLDGGGDAPARFSCTVSGTWWIDIDANPALIGVPVTATLNGGDLGGCIGCPATASMTVRLTKK